MDKAELTEEEKLSSQVGWFKRQVQDISSLTAALLDTRKPTPELYEFNSSIYLTLNSECIIQSLTFPAALFFGMERNSLIDKSFLDFLTEESKLIFQLNIETLLEKKFKQVCEVEIFMPRGKSKYVILESLLINDQFIHVYLIDITNNRQLKMQVFELEKTLNLVQSLFQNSNDAIAATDYELDICLVNHSFSEVFAKIFSLNVYVGTNLNEILVKFPEIKLKIIHACQEALLGKKISFLIENPIGNNETYYCYEMTINSLFNEYTKQNEFIFRLKDLTEFKLQERLQHKIQSDIALSSRANTMEATASALAHEINQPLTAIIAYSRSCLFLIKNQTESKKGNINLLPVLEQIALQAEHAGEIINTMKSHIRNGNTLQEELDINALIRETLAILHYELLDYKLKINLDLQDNLPRIMAVKTHIMQVILNLARNSKEALQSVAEEKPLLLIKTRQKKNDIMVTILDNGPGIPEKFQNQILNAYFTTKPQGTGIGLGICRSLIEDHGGTLKLMRAVTNGACFCFTLPIKSRYVKRN